MTSVNENNHLFPPVPPTEEENIIPGRFEYIKDSWQREMLVNAWQAITITENWDFVKQDIDSFMWSNDPRINIISKKMEELGLKPLAKIVSYADAAHELHRDASAHSRIRGGLDSQT